MEIMGDKPDGRTPVNVGIVVIGRNEGERLGECLKSVLRTGCPAVYVDSGSTDDSVATASHFGVDIVQLDPTRPFSAARARNEGFSCLLKNRPSIRLVQFVDGDCILLPGWIEAAIRALSEDSRRSAVIGGLLERNADASPYNRLCALEWRRARGDLENYGDFGGISMIWAEVFRELGGFRPDMIAGEDSELGVRMGLAGYKITKIDTPMATHDANMLNFRQWWRRAMRAGHAIGQRSDIHGRSAVRDCVRERNSTLFWGIALPLVVLLMALPTRGGSLYLLAAYLMLGFRVWRYRTSLGDGSRDAFVYATFIVIGKIANAVGLVKFFLTKFARGCEINEYK